MICPACGAPTRVYKTLRKPHGTVRIRVCSCSYEGQSTEEWNSVRAERAAKERERAARARVMIENLLRVRGKAAHKEKRH